MRNTKIVALGLAALSLCPSASQAGVGVVALQTADPPCTDASGATYVDCGNGTVTDNRTGLVWLKNAHCLEDVVDWDTAMEVVAGLSDLQGSSFTSCGLSDGSSPGEWRLPSKAEWAAMVEDAIGMSCIPTITDDQGTGCWTDSCHQTGSCAFADVNTRAHWSTTTVTSALDWAFVVNTNGGGLAASGKANFFVTWPVRGVSQTASGVVALQTADPSCADDSGAVYVDCGNGTVTDNRTGLVWLKNADCLSGVNWPTAMEVVAGLSDLSGSDPDDCDLSDGSSPGEWRLPSKAEWEAMVDDGLGQGGDPDCTVTPPTITNDSGAECWVSGPSSFSGVVSSNYWGSTSDASVEPANVFGVFLGNGDVSDSHKLSNSFHVWPVRGGQ